MGFWDDFRRRYNISGPNMEVPGLGSIVGHGRRELEQLLDRNSALKGAISGLGSPFGMSSSGSGGRSKSILGDLGRNVTNAIGQGGAIGEGNVGMGMVGGQLTREPLSLAEQLQQQFGNLHPQYTPLEQLTQQANSQINAQFDPQINELIRQMAATKGRAKQNTKQATGMYNALAEDLAAQIPEITNQMKASQDAATDRYAGAQQELQKQYDTQKQQQQDTLTQLGIQAAAPDAQAQAATDQSYFQNQMNLDNKQTLDALAEMGQSEANYQQNISNTSRLAGSNAANDIRSQLETYLQGAQGQLGDLRASKGNSLQALIQQLTQSDRQYADQQYQNQFGNMMDLNRFQMEAQGQQDELGLALQRLQMQQMEQQMQNSNAGNLFKGTSGMQGMNNFLTQQYGNDPSAANAVANLVKSVLDNPEVQQGRHNNLPITNEYLVSLLRQLASQQGVTNGNDINNAIDALAAYKGQLR